MNILYISYLIGKKSEGPNYSVPSQIKAQAKYDNVLWFNINYIRGDCWNTGANFINLSDVSRLHIDNLPQPFNRPDLVVFEGVYVLPFCKIAKQLIKSKVPYIIIPRSSLTSAGQHSKILKKKIGNLIFFKKFIKNASAIQYLTKDEFESSGSSWNKTSLIISNGISRKSKSKVWKGKTTLKGVFIGRTDIYQKGIDLLIEALKVLKSEMRNASCTIDIYGPDRKGSKHTISKLIAKNGIEDLIHVHDAVFGYEKESVLLDSDFFILTSRFEGHPMGLIEALSYGLPCLVTKGTNMTEEIAKANAGWTAEINTNSIIKALISLLNDRGQFMEKGQNALGLSKQYNWDELAIVSSQNYRDLIERI